MAKVSGKMSLDDSAEKVQRWGTCPIRRIVLVIENGLEIEDEDEHDARWSASPTQTDFFSGIEWGDVTLLAHPAARSIG